MVTLQELRKTGNRPRLHPNGFVQLNVDDKGHHRIHVWPAKPLPAQKTRHTIHDHAFDMYSSIVVGQLTNLEYEFNCLSVAQRESFKGQLYKLHTAVQIGGNDTVLKPDVLPAGWLLRTICQTFVVGQAYSMRAGVLHDSVPRPGKTTMTYMVKTAVYPHYRPLVAVPVGVEPDNDFRRETVSEAMLWDVIEQAFKGAA